MIINGNALAQSILTKLRTKIKKDKLTPCLALITVGYHEPSYFYFRQIEQEAARVGINIEKRMLLYHATEQHVLTTIKELNNNPAITSILLQFPLPPHIQEQQIVGGILPHKDVDGFHPVYRALLLKGTPQVIPPAIAAIAHILKSTKVKLENAYAVLLTHSATFGAPLKAMLEKLGLTTKLIFINLPPEVYAKNVLQQLKRADVVVSALGFPGIIEEHHVKHGVVILDLGFTRKGTLMMGDVAIPITSSVPSFITPVPGGIGPVTAAMLLKNVVEASKKTL